LEIFLSHSHGDDKLAAALKLLLDSCLPGHIDVKVSSAPEAEGGVPLGGDWLNWVRVRVRTSKFTVVVLTPKSVDRPWLMWEAGAVSGAALAAEKPPMVIPLLYRLTIEQIPSPLQSHLGTSGESRESIRRLLDQLRQSTPMPASVFSTLVDTCVPQYLDNVARALADTPPPLTESAINDWLDRITYFERTNRRSEIGHLHRAMVKVFAPGDNAFDTPLDVRLHRRLGDIYLFSKQPREATRQFDLALRLSPRDVVLMHKKGLALLETGSEPGAHEMLTRLFEIDPEAATSSTEIAGLKGRLHWQAYLRTGSVSELRTARDTYGAAWAHNPDSHYMADNVGQLSLLLGEVEIAHDAFRKGLEALQKTGDRGYWALATKASCHLGLGQQSDGLDALREVVTVDPEPAVLDSIRRGLVRLNKGLKGTDQDLGTWLSALSGQKPLVT